MLAASCVPTRSASNVPRSLLGTTGTVAAASGAASASAAANASAAGRATAPTTRARAAVACTAPIRRASLGNLAATERESDLDPARRVEPRRIGEGDAVDGREARVVRAPAAREHGAVEEACIEHVEDPAEQRGVA